MIDFCKIDDNNRSQVEGFFREHWGAPIMISRSRVHTVSNLDGFIMKDGDRIIGLATYSITGTTCEIVSLNSILENHGVGSMLVNLVIEEATKKGCKRLWLITTNDNTIAIRFFQKRGFDMCGFFRDAVADARILKPEIPERGCDGIAIRHELEFERML